MKTRKLLFCLLLLLLGTATAWADKYFMPKSYRSETTPRLTLNEMIEGKRFMIYNAAIDKVVDDGGNVKESGIDKTGFLRNGGAQFQHDKSKERDKYIYNESFVYTLEKHTDDTGIWYAIRSLSTGTYVDCNGVTTHKNAADAKLQVYSWDEAKDQSNRIASWVDMECWKYNIVDNTNINHDGVIFVVGGKDAQGNNVYWSGGTDSFSTDQWLGHPYVFYEAIDFTDEKALPVKVEQDFIQELHVYSRCNMYAAQRVYGYVHIPVWGDNDHIKILDAGGTPKKTDNGIHLVDGDGLTALNLEAGESLRLFFNNGKKTNAVHIHLQRNADKTNSPSAIKVEASNDGVNWIPVNYGKQIEVSLTPSSTTAAISLGGDYSYIRILNADSEAATSLSEVYVLPVTGVVEDVIGYVNETSKPDNVIHTKATAQVYIQTIEEYNKKYPAVKLLSGIPFPGNKYRIYADVFFGKEHEKHHIYVSGGAATVGGAYFSDSITADKRMYYEWYCERLADGSLAFRNVVTGTYLTLNGTLSAEPYGWNINTTLTQRNGVPLEHDYFYLTVYNDYSKPGFVETNQQIQNQQYSEYCTDFVFLPVDVAASEKKITFKSNELVMRNTVFTYNGKVHTMPYSHMFIKEGENEPVLPKLELLCPIIHPYVGVKVNEGETRTDIASVVEENGKKFLKFDWSKIKNGDVLDIQFTIAPPFEITPTANATDKEPQPKLYLIRNKRTKGLQQQVHPNRVADSNIGFGDGPVSVAGGRKYYAKFDTRNTNMSIVPGFDDADGGYSTDGLDATSLFYFTQTESNDPARYYSVSVNNATTVMKFAKTGKWNENGDTWYVQPDHNGAYSGYNIGATKLNATNMPADAWSAGEDADVITFSDPNDDGTAWDFVKVEVEDAKLMLKEFIDKVAAELNGKFKLITPEIAARFGYDTCKVQSYQYMIDEIVRRVGDESTPNGYYATGDIFKLVQYAQNIHMIEHEVEYALYELPLISDEDDMGPEEYANPKWYYIRNVAGNNYAAYTQNDLPMNLEPYPDGEYPDGGMRLKNLFYFAGNKNSYAPLTDKDLTNDSLYVNHPGNNLILDEYLKIHLHNFMAERNTLVSKNLAVLNVDEETYPGYGMQKISDIPDGGLGGSENWVIEAEYSLDGTSFNAYGSCLLSSKEDALDDDYYNSFQIYFKDDRSVVIKVHDEYDTHTFMHTQEYYSKIKLVVIYSFGKLTIEVHNSAGGVESFEKDLGRIGVKLDDIKALYSAFPKDKGITVDNLVVRKTERMNWKEHLQGAQYDLWYIFPSSNLNKVGFAITLDGPNEKNMGWTNANNFVDTDLGNLDKSSWQFERVTDFDDHINELLDIYNLEDCVIYNKELAALMKLIIRNKAIIEAKKDGEEEERAFNEVYYAITNYKGPKPEELIAPKPGRLYTIRPVVDEMTDNALLVHVDARDAKYSTKEVYNADAIRDDKSYDSRAAWIFESNVPANDAGFLPLTGLKVKNIHTQCYFMPLTVDSSMVNEVTDATVALAPLGACTTMFKVGEGYMAQGNVVKYAVGSGFWGENAIKEYPTAVDNVLTSESLSDATVYCKELEVKVATKGDVTVTFTHIDGAHKLNILGVELVGAGGNVVNAKYHYGTAGNEHVNNVYELGSVEQPGVYTLKCYVCQVNDDYLQRAGGKIVVDGIAGTDKITNRGDAKTQWIVEEILDPEECVYYETNTYDFGCNTLKLGFPAKIPDGVEAFHARIHGDIKKDRYVIMDSYGEPGDSVRILPSNTAVVLRNLNGEAVAKNYKFYYSAMDVTPASDTYLHGALYYTIIECASYDTTDFDGDGNGDGDVNIYMLQSNKGIAKLYWIYEERSADGTIKDGHANTDKGGYIACKANKAFVVLPKKVVASISSLSLNYDEGETTEIEDIETGDVELIETVYDILGRKLKDIAGPGVYIVNGKKIFVK